MDITAVRGFVYGKIGFRLGLFLDNEPVIFL